VNRRAELKRTGGPKRRKPLRADPEKVGEFHERARQKAQSGAFGRKPLRARNGLERKLLPRNPRRRKASRRLPGATGWTARVFALYGRRCVVCGKRATQAHHTVPRRVILDDTRKPKAEREQLAYDARNGCPVCADDHSAHENASRRIPRRCIPEGAIAWAKEFGYGHRVNDRRVYPVGEPERSVMTDQGAAA
jgi:hypothetical protein